MGFNWAVRQCPQADILLFHDDDYHVKYRDLAIHLRDFIQTNKTIFSGSLAINAIPYRNRGERWFVTVQQYPFDFYPPYLGGGAYVVSMDIARKLYLAFPHVKYLNFDDVYLGIVARKIGVNPSSDMLLDTLNPLALAQECSHKAEEVFKGKCPLATTKREIANMPEITEDEENITYSANSSIMQYVSFEKSFSYPMTGNLKAAINGKVIHNHLINMRNINAHPFLYVHQPKPIMCKIFSENKKKKNIIIFVKSYVKNVDQRTAIRTMWNKTLMEYSTSLNLVFLLAQPLFDEDQYPVEKESTTHGDILQEDFKEHYRNNTYKYIMALNWIMPNRACSKTTNVLVFLDDDYYVHQGALLTYIRTLSPTDVFVGKVMKNQEAIRVNGAKRSLVYKEYPYDQFPPYINGGAFILSYDVARKFRFSFPYVRYLSVDDVYLGIVAWKLDIQLKHDSVFDTGSDSALAYECSHMAQRLLIKECPLRGHRLTSTVPKLVKRRDGFFSRFMKLPQIVLSLFKAI